MRPAIALLAVSLFAAAPAFGAPTAIPGAIPGAIIVTKAWVRPAPAGGVTAGYFTLTNRGRLGDRLTGASSPIAERVGLHESRAMGSMMVMRRLAQVTIAGGGSVAFIPGGRHLMIERLRRPLRLGESAPITLDLDRAGRITARFQVRAASP